MKKSLLKLDRISSTACLSLYSWADLALEQAGKKGSKNVFLPSEGY